jgi:hypothetical protein
LPASQAHDLADLPEELPEEPGRGSREVARLLGEVENEEEDENELAEMEEDYRRKHCGEWEGGGREEGSAAAKGTACVPA